MRNNNFLNLKLILLSVVLLVATGIQAQFSFSAENATTAVQFVPCGDADTLEIDITAAGAQTSAQVGVKLPANAVFMSHVSGGSLLSSTPAGDSFTVSLGNMTSGQKIRLIYRVAMNCSGASNPTFNVAYRATSTTHTTNFTGQSYASSVYSPVLQFLAVDVDTSGLATGGTHTRYYTISNSSASAISYFDSITFKSKYKAGEQFVDLKIGTTTVTPTVTGDSLVYIIAGSMLDTDNKLNGGQSISVEERVTITDACMVSNTTTDPVQAYWTCFSASSCTAPQQINATTQVAAAANQIVSSRQTNSFSACRGDGPDTMRFKVWNVPGSGVARDVTFGIAAGYMGNAYSYTDQRGAVHIVPNSISATRNGVAYNILADTVATSNKRAKVSTSFRTGAPIWYAGIPTDALQDAQFSVDSLNPGDTIEIMCLIAMPCGAEMTDFINHIDANGLNTNVSVVGNIGGMYRLQSENDCGNNRVYSHNTTSGNLSPSTSAMFNATWTNTQTGTTNYSSGDTGTIRHTMTDVQVGDAVTVARSTYTVNYTVPVGLVPKSLNPSDYQTLYLSNNSVNITAYKVSYVGNVLSVSFRGRGFARNTYMDIDYYLDCGLLTGAKIDSIHGNMVVNMDTTCTTGCMDVTAGIIAPIQVALHCPGSIPSGGLEVVDYVHRRWNIGEADYDNDGKSDGTGTADIDSVKTAEYFPGDTMYTRQYAKLTLTGSSPAGGFPNVYAVHQFLLTGSLKNATFFNNIGTDIRIYDQSSASTYTFNAVPAARHVFGDSVYFIYDLSQAAIAGQGTIPAGFTWANGDSVDIKTNYRFLNNQPAEATQEVPSTMDLYAATTTIDVTNSGTIEAHTKYVNDVPYKYNDLFHGVSRFFSTGGGSFYENNSCVSQTFYKNMYVREGTCCGTYNNLHFRNEYRPIVKYTRVTLEMPRRGIRVDSVLFQIYGGNTYPVTSFTIPSSAYTVLADSGYIAIDPVAGLASAGFATLDEGFTLQARAYYTRTGSVDAYNPSSYPAGRLGFSADYSEAPFADLNILGNNSYGGGFAYVRFINPNFSGQAVGATDKSISANKTSFDVRLDNLPGTQQMNVDSAWIYVYSPSGKISLTGAKTTGSGTALPVTNGKLVRLGNLNIGSSEAVTLDLDFSTGCGTDSVMVFYSWNCVNTNSPITDTGLFNNHFPQDTTILKITKFDPQLENSIVISRTQNIALCDTILISNLVNNAGSGKAYDIDFTFSVPNFGTGVEIVPGTYRLIYPANTGTAITIPAPTNLGGGQYKWVDVNQYVTAIDTGGLETFLDTNKNKMRITYQLRFTCGFNSGLTLNTESQASCGSASTAAFTTPIRLKAENLVNTQFYNMTTTVDSLFTCGPASGNVLNSEFTNLSASVNPTGANDSVFIILPSGVTYNSAVTATPRAPDVVSNNPDGTQTLAWNVPSVAVGASVSFSYGIKGEDTLSCTAVSIISRSGAFVQDTCILDGSLCLTGVIKSENTTNLSILKPSLSFSSATATSIVNSITPSNELVTINYEVMNAGESSSSHTLKTYYDADASGTFTTGDVLVNTKTQVTTIANSATYSGSYLIDVNFAQVCPLVVVLEKDACQCVMSEIALGSVKLNNAGMDSSICSGESISLGTGVGPVGYSYAWTPTTGLSSATSTSPTFTGVNTGTSDIVTNYILTTTRSGTASCTSMDTAVITVKPLPMIGDVRDTAICNGSSVDLTTSGGGTYAWNTVPVQTTATISVSPTTNTQYIVTVTGTNGCKVMDSAVVSLKASPTADAGPAKSRINCSGDSVQIGTAAGSGNTYAWSPATGLSATNVAEPWAKPATTTKYYLTVTNTSTGCESMDSVEVTVTAPTLAANAGNPITVCQGAPTVTLGGTPAATGGTLPYTYAWSGSGLSATNISNPTKATTTAGAVTHNLTVTDAKGCIATSSILVTIDPKPTVAPTASPSTVCNGESSTIAANATGGTTGYTYNWSPAGSGASHSQSPVSTTNYSVTVTDSKSCTATGTVTLNVTGSSPLVANAGNAKTICSGASTTLGGAPTASGGSGGYTYAWDNGAGTTANPTVSPTTTTTYKLTVTSGGCTDTTSVTVTVNPSPTTAPTASPSTICNGASTTVAANASGGTGTLTYNWNVGSGSSHTATPTANTTYNVTVTDANSCTATGSVSVNVTGTSPLVANAGNAKTICSGASTTLGGTPTASGGSGGYTYAWDNGAGTTANPTVSPTSTTTYTVTVTSSTCTASSSVTVTVNPSPTVAPTASPSTICNGETTTISANASGGTGTLTYAWSGGSGASFTATPTSNTTYGVTVTDANSCTASGSVTVNVTGTSPLVANAGNAATICNGASATLGGTPTATGGSGAYTYAWDNGAGTTANPSVSPTSTTTYQLIVSSAGCMDTASVVVTVNPIPTTSATASPSTICYGSSSTIAANASGGTGTLTYGWNQGSGASHTVTPTTNTTYNVTVTDANLCTATSSVTVNVTGSSPLNAVAGNARAICNGASTVLGGSPTASGGAGVYTYAWDNGAGTTANPTVSPTTTTTYTLTVSSSGCSDTSMVTVTVNPTPTIAPTASPTTICNGESTTISANASGGTGTLSYMWSPSGTGSSFTASPNATTTYNVTVTDINMCTASGNVTVNVTGSSPLTANAGNARTICNGSSTTLGGSPTGSGGNTAGTYTYQWDNGAGTAANPSVSPTTTTTYNVTVTNTACTATSSVVVTVNPKPNAAPAASVNPVCSGSNTTLSANPSGGGGAPYTYAWNTGQTSATFVVAPTATGAPVVNAYTVTVTDVNMCTVSGNVNLTVRPLPTVAGIAPISVCIPATGGNANLSASALTAGQTGAWSTVTSPTGTVSFGSATSATTTASTLSPINNYIFKWTVTENGCINSTNASVTVNESPVIDAGMNDTICNGASSSLSASVTSISPANMNWKVNTLTATPFAFTTNTTVSPTVSTNYIFTAAIGSCIVSDTVSVAVIQAPDLVDEAACLAATEDVPTTFDIPTTIGTNDDLSGVLRGGVSYAIVSSGNSTVTLTGTTINYASNLNFYGNDTVVIEAWSTECPSLRDTSMFCVAVAGVNDTVMASNDTVQAIGTNPVTFNPLSNDTDVESGLSGSNLTVLSGPNSGTITGPTADGEITYTGNASNYAGLDTIVYQVCDTGLPLPATCDTAMVVVQLIPDVKDTTTETTPGSPVTLGPAVTTGPGVTMTPTVLGPNNGSGTATIDPTTGVVTFTPSDTPFIGNDTITKILCFDYPDGSTVCDTSVTVISNPSTTNPVVSDTTPMNTPVTFAGLNPVKFEGTPVAPVVDPKLTINADGTVTYTPTPGFVGVDTVEIVRCDDKGNCVTDVFVIKVTPEFGDTTVSTSGTDPVDIGPGITAGPGSTITKDELSGPSNGTVTKNPDGTLTYTPSGTYVGNDTITRIVCVRYPDGSEVCDTQVIVISNTTPPTTIAENAKSGESTELTKLPVRTFEGGDPTTTVTASNGGTLTFNADGTPVYTSAAGFSGTETITVIRCDSLGNCDTTIFEITVEEVVTDVPNYFSPNGDGVNDVWNLDGILGKYPNAKAIIYNRWGNIVWRSTGSYGRSTSGNNLWYGQLEGSSDIVPDGVYYYLIELEDEFKTTKTGFIEIMRQ